MWWLNKLNFHLQMPVSHKLPQIVPVYVPSAPLLILLSEYGLGSSGGWPKPLGHCISVEDLEEDPGSWLHMT